MNIRLEKIAKARDGKLIVTVRFGDELRSCEVISYNWRTNRASVKFKGSDGDYHGRHINLQDLEDPEEIIEIQDWDRRGDLLKDPETVVDSQPEDEPYVVVNGYGPWDEPGYEPGWDEK